MDAKTLNALVHDREAALYDERFLIEYGDVVARELRRDLERLLGTVPAVERALDVACGTGYAAVGLAASGIARAVHASDLSIEMAKRTRANADATGVDVKVSLSDAERLPYDTGSFDLVIARGALHHLPDPLAALAEIKRVLADGGTAVVLAEPTPDGEKQVGAVVGLAVRVLEGIRKARGIEPDQEELERRHWELASMAANLHTFLPSDIEALAEKAGFQEISVGTASWAWILTLGMNYYLVGEFEALARSNVARSTARALARWAANFDRAVGDRVIPARWRHTVQAVLR
ncbi:MAG TPA: class I SAM-dependent methyltransferase [Actinomycetota bacterium]|nr:class I SAM-dependent methyltransferase [Actinomycetota bacterium]